MRITYSAPVRSHHYPYAEALHRAGYLNAFISGFSRLSPRSPLPSIGDKLKRHDFFMTLYLACLKFKVPFSFASKIYKMSNVIIDYASYRWAKESDAFIFYRTQGLSTTLRLHKDGLSTLCVMEEVNSHVEYANSLLFEEYKRLKLKNKFMRDPDYSLRLKTYEEVDCILCPSEFVRRSFLLKGFSNKQLIKVNFGFPAIEISEPKKFENDTFRILFVGQLNYRKGLSYAIEAFKRIKHPSKEFIIVGPKTPVTGLERTLIPTGVKFMGPLKDDALKEEYRRASVFVLPSIEEGLALVQGEALAFGTPVLITTNTGGDDFITDGTEGFIVPPTDVNALSDRLQLMADDKELLKRMSVAALHTARTFGSWDIAVCKLIMQIKEILECKSS